MYQLLSSKFKLCLILVVVLLFATTVVSATASTSGFNHTTVTMCLLLPANVDDLSVSYQANVGRLKAKEVIETTYDGAILDTYVFTNTPTDYPTSAALTEALAAADCTLVVSIGCCLFDEQDVIARWEARARLNPKMTYLVQWNDAKTSKSPVTATQPPNLVFFINDYTSSYFLAGVAAATQASTCAGIMVPYAWHRSSHDAATGFALGVHYANASMPVHVALVDRPSLETKLWSLWSESYGCEVVARYSDVPSDLSKAVEDAFVDGEQQSGSVSTVGVHTDQREYVGDTVLLSVEDNWTPLFTAVVEGLMKTGAVAFPAGAYHNKTNAFVSLGSATGVVTPSSVSPKVSPSVGSAVESSKASAVDGKVSVLCRDNTANLAFQNQAKDHFSDVLGDSACRIPTDPLPHIALPSQAIYHGEFQPLTDCRNGTAASYTTDPTVSLRCDPCPKNTYAVSGSAQCTPCPEGLNSSAESSSCRPIAVSEELDSSGSKDQLETAALIAIVAIVVVLFIIIVAIIGYFARQSYLIKKRNELAPKSGPLCLLYARVKTTTSDSINPKDMDAAETIYTDIVRSSIASYRGYEVSYSNWEFCIATQHLNIGTTLALDIQLRLNEFKHWPEALKSAPETPHWNGLPVAISIHLCADVEVKYDETNSRYGYEGVDALVANQICSSFAAGGQILFTSTTYHEVQKDLHILDIRSVVQPWAKAVALESSSDASKVVLFSILPTVLADRTRDIEKLTGHTNDFTNENGAEMQMGLQDQNSVPMSGDDVNDLMKLVLHLIMQQTSHRSCKRMVEMLRQDLDITSTDRNYRTVLANVGHELTRRWTDSSGQRRHNPFNGQQ